MKKTIAQAYANMTAEDMVGYIEGSFDDGLWIRGHHDPEVFSKACVLEYEGDIAVIPKPEDIRHEYWRIKRVNEDEAWDLDGRYDYVYVPTKKGRGAFPVTVWS